MVIGPTFFLLTIIFSICVTGITPSVVLVKNASLHSLISLILKGFSITFTEFLFAISSTLSLVTPPRI